MCSFLCKIACHHAGPSGHTLTHSPNKHHLPVARWLEVSSGGQFLFSGWPHYPATRIWSTQTLLGTPELHPGQPRPLRILLEEVGPCSNWHVPLWQTPNDVAYYQQLSTVQAEGGCSDCTQLMTLLPNDSRHMARKCTRQQQQLILSLFVLFLKLLHIRLSPSKVNLLHLWSSISVGSIVPLSPKQRQQSTNRHHIWYSYCENNFGQVTPITLLNRGLENRTSNNKTAAKTSAMYNNKF